MLDAVRSYARAVIEEEWSDMAQGTENSVAWQGYNHLWQIIRTLEPHSPAEINWHAIMLQSLTTLSNYRRDRLADSRSGAPTRVMACPLERGAINLGYTYLFGVKSLPVHLLITMALTAMTTLLLVILILDHPFAGSFRVESEPFVRVLRRMNQLAPQTPEQGF